jgi:hypothetical protein
LGFGHFFWAGVLLTASQRGKKTQRENGCVLLNRKSEVNKVIPIMGFACFAVSAT